MGKGSKFSFPIPGRKPAAAADRHPEDAPPMHHGWNVRHDYTQRSKAERLLGFDEPPRMPSRMHYTRKGRSGSNASHDTNHSHVTVSVSDHDFEQVEGGSRGVLDDYSLPRLHPRASSNALGAGLDGRAGSSPSRYSRQIHNQGSSSTLRSYYDPKKSPLSVSQQTSASAVRDGALRKGYPGRNDPVDLHSRGRHDDERSKNSGRRNKPTRLDLSRFFPKPKSQGTQQSSGMLSPTKFVDSPTRLSTFSEYIPAEPPRPPYAEDERPGSKKSSSSSQKQCYKGQDRYDNAKVNVRKPPQGIHHWFDGLSDFDDDDEEEEGEDLEARRPSAPNTGQPRAMPVRKSSLGNILNAKHDPKFAEVPRKPPLQEKPPHGASTLRDDSRDQSISRERIRQGPSETPPAASVLPFNNKGHNVSQITLPSTVFRSEGSSRNTGVRRSTISSQHSSGSHTTSNSVRTREGKIGASNLQQTSVLSFSSSDEEDEDKLGRVPLRDSLAVSTDNESEIIIGKAKAFDIHTRSQVDRAESKLRHTSDTSVLSTSTSAATIDIMLATSPRSSHLVVPRKSKSKRSAHAHLRQPSAIPEDDGRLISASRMTDERRPMSPSSTSPSLRSEDTSRSESRSNNEPHHKLMAVTQEEEALLEMMRRKRAAMAKATLTEDRKSPLSREQSVIGPREAKPRRLDLRAKPPRTSGFLAMDSPSDELMDAFPAPSSLHSKRTARSRSSTQTSAQSFDRGGTWQSRQPSPYTPNNLRRDVSTSTTSESTRNSGLMSEHESNMYHLAPDAALGHSDHLPATPTTSVTSPTTVSHASPLPSPVTPGPRTGEADNVEVKVASSEPSCNGDDADSSSVTGGALVDSVFPRPQLKDRGSSHTRRRTASSGADAPTTSKQPPERDLEPELELLSSSVYVPEPKKKASQTLRRKASDSLPPINTRASTTSSSNASTIVPNSARSSIRDSHVPSTTGSRKRHESGVRDSAAMALSGTRCSASEDVLAAWGSLGGWRDVGGF